MSTLPTPRPASFRTKLIRQLVAAYFGHQVRRRKPPHAPGQVIEHPYGPNRAERLEYIEPAGEAPTRAAVVYLHGGGWILGKKESYTRFLSFLAEAGHPVFNVEYPLAPENPHPGILRSLLHAMEWICSNHKEISGVHFMGDSAGGNLAMMMGLLAANPDRVRDVDPDRGAVALPCHSVVSLYGVLDRLSWLEDGFPQAESMLESYGGKAAFEPEVPPELAITPMDLRFEAAPPSFVCAGTEDPLCRSSRLFAERLAAGPGKVVHKEYPGEAHGFFNIGKTSSDALLREDVLAFLEATDPGRR